MALRANGAASGAEGAPRTSGECLMQTSNTPLAIPDLMALAKAIRTAGDRAAALRTLVIAIQNVFSSPGLLIAGFSLPPVRQQPARGGAGGPGSHGLDIDAIARVYETVLLLLEPDVVLALRGAITGMLNDIVVAEERLHQRGASLAVLQAQWLKVRSRHAVLVTDCDSQALC